MTDLHMTLSLSVIIPNFNYGRFVGAAIESALAIDWPQVEIIVVDDGSTDDSLRIIRSYKAIKLISQANLGQAAACDIGFAQSSGDLIIFLDSDDLLDPRVMKVCMRKWRMDLSKFQFQMIHIDEAGTRFGTPFPMFNGTPSPEDIRAFYRKSSAYPTPPGSGNIYTRRFISRISPLRIGDDRAADSYYLAAAPLLGDVITIVEALGFYRVHGANSSAMTFLKHEVFGRDLLRAIGRNEFAATIAAENDIPYPNTNLFRSLKNLSLRICSLVYSESDHPIRNDSRLAIILDCIRAAFVAQGNSATSQLLLSLWIILISLLPRALSQELVKWRFVPSKRPAFIKQLLHIVSVKSAAR